MVVVMMHLRRYSLRALLVGFTALCVLFGYEANWIHRRERFITEQRLKQTATFGEMLCDPGPTPRPPVILRLLRASGYKYIGVVVPEAHAVERKNYEILEYDIYNTQPDFARARRLFPEAVILPYALCDGFPHRLNVRDAVSGKIELGEDDNGDFIWPREND